MALVTPAQLLQALAGHGSLEKACAALGVSLDEARTILRGAARALEGEPAAAVAPVPVAPVVAGGHRRLRVYSDGASRGNPGPAGAGAVLKDGEGQPLEKLGKFLGKQTNNVAEYEGLLLGLRRAHELGAREIDVFADSQLLIRQLQGSYQVKSPVLQRLHAEAMALLRGFSRTQLEHIPRERNVEADEMSNRAIDERL